MRNFLVIFGKEMRSYFGSPVAYVVAAVFLLFMGFIFRNLVLEFHQMTLFYQAKSSYSDQVILNVNDVVVVDFFSIQFFIWLIVSPMLTMRLFAEEKKNGTMELLMTSPVTIWQVLLGKFAACLGFYTILEALALSLLSILTIYTSLDWGQIFSASLAVIFLGATFISVGILSSSFTENQIVAVLISFFLLITLWLIDWASRFAGPMLAEVLRSLSLLNHMRDMIRGIIDTNDAVFLVSMTAFFLFLTYFVLESRRWRQ